MSTPGRPRGEERNAPETLPPSGEELPAAPAFDEEGVDRSLILDFLARSPAERLDLVDAYAQKIEALRACMSRDRPLR